MPGKTKIRFEVTIQAPVAQLYRAFTNPVGLEEWLCDSAWCSPRPGGNLFLSWNTGYSSSGKFINLEPGKSVSFTWRGSQDPAETLVTIRFKEVGNSTAIEVIHSGIWEGKKWEKAEHEIKQGWVTGLRTLSCVLETGSDPRITSRPMLGVYLGDPNPELLKAAGAPVSSGVRLEGVVEGMGAQACGLQKNDVLIEMDGIQLHNNSDLGKALSGRKAGDVLKVSFYRQAEQITVDMKLAARKTQPLPASAAALASEIGAQYAATDGDLFPFLNSMTDEAASQKSSPQEWNVKDNLAHLIHCERDLQAILHRAITSERFDFSENTPARIKATLEAYPRLIDLVNEFKHAESETLAFVAALPDDFTQRKGSFWVLTNLIYNFNSHTREHLEQMRKTIASQ